MPTIKLSTIIVCQNDFIDQQVLGALFKNRIINLLIYIAQNIF